MTKIQKDKDPILDQKFFDLLFPIAYPNNHTNLDIFNFCKYELSIADNLLSSGSLLEKAISVSKKLTRHSTIGKDFVDGSDAKTASVRWCSNNTAYGAPIHDIFNKKGLLRCVVYERLQDKFYYFLIPRRAYALIPKSSNIEIPFELNGNPRRNAKRIRNVDWWTFEVDGFAGILGDTPSTFEFVKEKKARLAAEKKALKLKKQEEKLLKKLSRPARVKRSVAQPKIDPTPQMSIPYSLDIDLLQIQDLAEILPISLYEIS